MSAPPELKYTDRDVREDDSLRNLALQYLDQYRGEFEPLVEAQQILNDGDELPVAIVRKVLNCMRHDRDWCDRLPAPERRTATVLAFRKRAPRKPDQIDKQCDQVTGHPRHPWGQETWNNSDWDYYWKYECQGVPWEIDRRNYKAPARVKLPFAAARTGNLIHSVNPDGPHTVTWLVIPHAFGWQSDKYDWIDADGELAVHLRCKYPAVIRRPILLKVEEVELYMDAQAAIGRTGVKRCPHCIKVEDSL